MYMFKFKTEKTKWKTYISKVSLYFPSIYFCVISISNSNGFILQVQ